MCMSDYERLLAKQPLTTQIGSTHAAAAFVQAIELFIADTSVMGALTDAQRKYVYKLRGRWAIRANGDDPRWLEQGSRPGRPVKNKRAKRRLAAKDPGEADPMFQSLMRKFGTPRSETD